MPFLPWALDDLARCEGGRLEVLVCDDGSDDGSAAWLRAVRAALPSPAASASAAAAAGAATQAVAARERGEGEAEAQVADPSAVHGAASRAQRPPSGERAFVVEEPWKGEREEQPPGAEAVAARLAARGHALVLLSSGGHGQGAAQNRCLAAATAPLISLMDADDRCPADRFLKLRAALAMRSADGWHGVCSAVRVFGVVSGGMARYVEWQNSLLEPEEMLANRFVEIPALHQSGLYPRQLLRETLGGYRDLPSWPIDIDTWMRLAEAGARVGKIPDKLYGWRQHVLQSTRNHGRCGLDHLRRCKARFLLRALPPEVQEIEVWSIGRTLEAWRDALSQTWAETSAGHSSAEGAQPPQHLEEEPLAQPRRGPSVPPTIRLVAWRPTKRKRRGGAGRRLWRPVLAVEGRTAAEGAPCGAPAETEAPPAPAPALSPAASPAASLAAVPAGGGRVARVFAFGSAEIRELARQAVTAGAADADAGGGKGGGGCSNRWARLDWLAA